ncbi:MAG: hypothetical protein IPG74_02680 [Flavobacteriales bacterium]|nr:hypothetical protein [Flavobacteriales bacterium]MBK7553118.1 hypothetical protein [Flavobacteriales bacterium]MBK9196001.1 hypothetical protein [Flavobacteriales bacterium]
MSQKPQGTKKWLRPVAYIGGAVLLLTALGFVEATNDSAVCNELVIDVDGRSDMHFLDADAVRAQVNDEVPVTGMALGELPIKQIEDRLRTLPSVADADAYHTLDGKLHVRVRQREPIVRVIDANGHSFYIDKEGWTMPVSDTWTARVPVAVGNVFEPATSTGVRNVLVADTTAPNSRAALVFNAVLTLRSDPFWNAMIDQIAVLPDGQLELIPRVGPRRVQVGFGDKLHQHLDKLNVFYKQGIANGDWRRYQRIDLRFADQVIATNRNPTTTPTH